MVLPRRSSGTISAAGPRRLRRIERADREHDEADGQQARIIRRKSGGEIGEREHRERRCEQGPALDPAGQPRRHRRADAQHDRAEGDQKPRGADADIETGRQVRPACPPAPAPSSR